MTKIKGKIPLLLCLGAVLTALTLLFPQIGALEWISMVPIFAGFYLLCDTSPGLWKSYRYGFLTVFVYYFVLYHWFINLYPLDFVGMDNASSVAVIVLGWVGLTLLQAIPGGLIFLFFTLIRRTGIFERLPILKPFVFSALWIVFEWSSTLTWTGVPWGRLCLGQIDLLPMVQISSVFGSYGLSFLLLIINGLLAYAVVYRTKQTLCGGLAAGLFFGNLVFGFIALNVKPEESKKVTAAVIQGNINSHDKWDSDSTEKTMQIYADMTRSAAQDGATLVIWPETALPYSLNLLSNMRSYVSGLAKECGVTLIMGAFYETEENEYNSLYLILPDGTISEDHYDKRHLVPFGEYVPMRNVIMTLFPPLAELSALDSDVTPGEGTHLFETDWGKIGSMICFDSIYEMLGVDSVRDGAGIMVISSNDSWFYDSAAVYQHMAQARLRAVEEGRYYLRAANTGISAIISPNGEVLRRIKPLVEGYEVCEVSFRTSKTLYTIIGNLFVYFCIAFCIAVLVTGIILRYRKHGKSTAGSI